MATIEKRTGKDGKLSFKISVLVGRDDTGKRIYKRATFTPTKKTERQMQKELDTFVADFERRVINGDVLEGEKITFNDAVKLWDENWAAEHLTLSVQQGYIDILDRRIKPHIGGIKLSKINATMIESILSDLRKDGKAIKTIKRTFTACNSVFKYCYRKGLIKENPCDRVELPSEKTEKMQKNFIPEIHFFDAEQAKAFINALDMEFPVYYGDRERHYKDGRTIKVKGYTEMITVPTVFKTFFILALYSGFRRGELLPLRWSDINFDDGTIRIVKAVAKISHGVIEKSPKTASGYREIELPRQCFDALKEWQAEQMRLIFGSRENGTYWNRKNISENYIFTQMDGRMMYPDSPSFEFKKIINRYNNLIRERIEKNEASENDLLPEISLHDLRHTSASLLIGSGIDPVTVANRLGHKDIRVTLNTYSHALKQSDKTASAKLNELLG